MDMSQEHKTDKATDNLTGDGQEALSALRGIWKAQGQTSADLDEATGNEKCCTNMRGVGFQGLVEDAGMSADPQSVGTSNLRAAWKKKLEREGKTSQGTSVRELIFGSADQEK
jgi:hypothetical protein